MRAPGPWIIGDLQQRRNAARSRVVYDVTRIVTRALNAAPNGIDRVDFALARQCLVRGEVGGEAIDYSIRLMDLDGCKPFAIVRRRSRRVVARRLRASAEETPPNAFLQRLTTIIAQL